MALLSLFTVHTWVEVIKEGQFREPLRKLAGFANECRAQGKKNIAEECVSWESLLTDTKIFL